MSDRYKTGPGEATAGEHAHIQSGAPPSPPTQAREGERGVSKQAPGPANRQDEGPGLEQDHPPASR